MIFQMQNPKNPKKFNLLTFNKSAVHSSSVFCILVSWAQLSLLKFSLLLLAALLSADCEAICKSHRYRHRSESLDGSSYGFGYSAKTAPRHANEKCLGKRGKCRLCSVALSQVLHDLNSWKTTGFSLVSWLLLSLHCVEVKSFLAEEVNSLKLWFVLCWQFQKKMTDAELLTSTQWSYNRLELRVEGVE